MENIIRHIKDAKINSIYNGYSLAKQLYSSYFATAVFSGKGNYLLIIPNYSIAMKSRAVTVCFNSDLSLFSISIFIIVKEVRAVRDYYDDPVFEEDLDAMEDYEISDDDADEELYEEYVDEYGDRYRFF